MYYVSWDWHVKSPHATTALEPLMRLSNPWRMGLLFLISGAATGWMFQARANGLLLERSARLLLPLLFGMFVIVPPQSYFEALHKVGYDGSYLEFLPLYLSGHEGLCHGQECLHVPTWNHLWFLAYLWLYTAVLVLVRGAVPATWRAGAANWLGSRPTWQLWVLPIVAFSVIRLALLTRYPSTHALVGDRFNHANYGLLFLIGVGLAARPHLFARLEPLRWPALGVTLFCWAGIGWYVGHVSTLDAIPEDLRALQRVAYASMQWSAIVAALAFGHRHLNRDHRWRAALTEAVLPMYLAHQTIIIVLAMAMAQLRLAAPLEGVLLALFALVTCLIFWRVARRAGPLRPLFGLTHRSRLNAPRPSTPAG